jgi:hypothetical protein
LISVTCQTTSHGSAHVLVSLSASLNTYLVRPLAILIVPLVLRIRQNRVRLATSIRIYQSSAEQIAVWDRMRICHAKRILVDGLDWSPHVDDLESLLQKPFRLIGQMMKNTLLGGRVRLVDMHSADWTT